MKFWLTVCLLGVLTSLGFALPYYVDPVILEEVKVNEQLLEQAPTDNERLFNLAMSYAYSGQILKGWNTLKQLPKSYAPIVIEEQKRLIEEDPAQWKPHFKSAFGYFFKGEKQEAIDSFHQVLTLDPNHVWALGFIGLVYGEMGEVDQAIDYSKRALEIEPNATAVHFLLGEAYRKKKKYFKAFRQLLKGGRLQSKH